MEDIWTNKCSLAEGIFYLYGLWEGDVNKLEFLDKIRTAVKENIYCGDVCYNYEKGEYCRVEGIDNFMQEVKRILNGQKRSVR